VYDAIVVGAGPSGSSAAYHLSRGGLKTLLIDKAKFPRRKACAGAVPEWVFRQLGLSPISDIGSVPIQRMRLFYNGRKCEVDLGCPYVHIVDRARWDAFLVGRAQRAGAHFVDRCWFLRAWPRGDAIGVATSAGDFACRYLIGADGLRSTVRTMVAAPHRKRLLALGMYVYRRPSGACPIPEGTIDIHFDGPRFGYCWVFHRGDSLSIGVAGSCLALDTRRAKAVLGGLLTELGSAPALGAFHLGFLPIGHSFRRLARRRVLLVGDAGGLVDAYAGEGISYAIESGRIAAEAVLRHGGRSYAKLCRRAFGGRLNCCLALALAVHSLPSVFKRQLLKPSLLALYLNTVRDGRSYGPFLAALFRAAFLGAVAPEATRQAPLHEATHLGDQQP